jgi:hypothetical protein
MQDLCTTSTLFVWLISHQPTVLFSQNKSAISNQSTVLFSQNKSAPAINHQPTEQAVHPWYRNLEEKFAELQIPSYFRNIAYTIFFS